MKKFLALTLSTLVMTPLVCAEGDKKQTNLQNDADCKSGIHHFVDRNSELKSSKISAEGDKYQNFYNNVNLKKGLPDLGDHGFISRVIYILYAFKGVRLSMYNEPNVKDNQIRAVGYLFGIINGINSYNPKNIALAYCTLDPKGNTKKRNKSDINEAFIKIMIKYLGNIPEVCVNINEGEKFTDLYDYLNQKKISTPSSDEFLVSIDRRDVSGKIVPCLSNLQIKNILKFNDKSTGREYNLSYVSSWERKQPDDENVLVSYLRNENGEWCVCRGENIKKVSEDEVARIASISGWNLVYSRV